MNDHNQTQELLCESHPNQALVGVCPLCLTDKLLAVASKQQQQQQHNQEEEEGVHRPSHGRKLSNVVGFPNIFAFGSFLNRLHNRRGTFDFDQDNAHGSDTQSPSTSLEDSFISIKFEENGVGLWDKKSKDHAIKGVHKEGNGDGERYRSTSVTSRRGGSMRWRKRIGHLLQLVRWKRPTKANCNAASSHSHVNGVSGIVKVRNRPAWIRTLTRRKTYKE